MVVVRKFINFKTHPLESKATIKLHYIPKINLLQTFQENKINFRIYTNDPRDQNIQNALAGFKTKPFGPIKYIGGPLS